MKDVTNSMKENKAERHFFKLKKVPGGRYICLLLLALIYYYFLLPPIHYASYAFWQFLLFLSIAYWILSGVRLVHKISIKDIAAIHNKSEFKGLKGLKKGKWLFGFWLLVFAFFGLSYIIFSPLFMADRYSHLINLQTADFKKDFPKTDVSQIPLIDRDTADRLGNRHLGAVSELVSQFDIAPDYTQINIKSHPYRVSPLTYAGFFRWLNHFKTGIPYYMQVDMVTGEAQLKKPNAAIKYSRSDKFFRNLDRHLRIHYPFTMFGNPSFEVDDQGQPYYVATTYERYFITREPKPTGAVLVNASTGEMKRYRMEEVPKWADRVQSAELILHQVKMNGLYRNGFWNSLFSKVGCVEPTEGYNYLPLNDDIYLYTGLTSVTADASNIGFVLVNMRTREASMYPLTAAAEFSAMESAEGSVQEKGYDATFPLLININGQPFYILSLKDSAGLIKQYALIDVVNYQTVWVAPSVSQLLGNYAQAANVVIDELEQESDIEEILGSIEEIQATVLDGNTVYYFMLNGKIYRANLKISDELPFIEAGEEVKIKARSNGQVEIIERTGPSHTLGSGSQAAREKEAENETQAKEDGGLEALNTETSSKED